MTSIIDFLEAQLEKDAATARAACWDGHDDSLAAQWDCGEEKDGRYWWVGDQWDDGVVKTTGDASAPAGQAAHIARHDPARVLREVQAKRRVMERHCPGMRTRDYVYCQACPDDRDGFPDVPIDECPELRDLAAIYSDHPDYRKEWAA